MNTKAVSTETDIILHGRQQYIIVVNIANRPNAANIVNLVSNGWQTVHWQHNYRSYSMQCMTIRNDAPSTQFKTPCMGIVNCQYTSPSTPHDGWATWFGLRAM